MAEYSASGENQDFLRELRENYASDDADWSDTRKQGRINMRFVSGESWDEAERREREDDKRLALNFDELSQYGNQVVNDSRQNKRAIQIAPNGDGADDKKAQLRANRIRQIEYRSNAQLAYTTMFQNTVERSFGWLRITAKYVREKTFEQELLITPIPNPDLVTPGPHVMSDGSDINRLWFHEWWSPDDFRREYGKKAKLKDFSGDFSGLNNIGLWVEGAGKRVRVAEYWLKEYDERELLLIRGTDGQVHTVWSDGIETDPESGEKTKVPIPAGAVLKRRIASIPRVCGYVTNGIEILKVNEWKGKHLPFVPCYGKVLFVGDENKSERKIHGLFNLARDPQKLYNYYRTTEAEIVGMTPKVPYFVRKGSLDQKNLEDLTMSNRKPVGVIQVEAMVPEMGAAGPPEFPQRPPYEPPIQAMEMGAESARRGIQASVGSSPLPTAAQHRNEKSGIALKQIQDTAQMGSFHLADNYNNAIMRTGVILNDLLPHYHDTAMDATLREPDDTTSTVRLNDPSWVNPKTQQPELLTMEGGDFDVTISTGPKVDSEREAASDFADLIIGSPEIAQIVGPEVMKKVIAKSIKLKNVGPIGDQISELIDPPEQQQPDPQQIQQQQQQAKQMLDLISKELEAKNEIIRTEQVKAQSAKELAIMNNAARIEVAKITASVKGFQMQTEADEEAIALGLELDHKADQNEHDRAHEAAMQAMTHEQTLQQTAQAGSQQAQLSDQGHKQALEQGAAGHEQTLEQGAQQAALAPPPEA